MLKLRVAGRYIAMFGVSVLIFAAILATAELIENALNLPSHSVSAAPDCIPFLREAKAAEAKADAMIGWVDNPSMFEGQSGRAMNASVGAFYYARAAVKYQKFSLCRAGLLDIDNR